MKKPNRYMLVDDDYTTTIICEYALRKVIKDATIEVYLRPEDALDAIKNENINDKEDTLRLSFWT